MALMEQGLVQGDREFIRACPKDYIQRNPLAADGRDGLKGFNIYQAENDMSLGYTKHHHVVPEGIYDGRSLLSVLMDISASRQG